MIAATTYGVRRSPDSGAIARRMTPATNAIGKATSDMKARNRSALRAFTGSLTVSR
jgi:hypothetical protein